MTRTRRIIATRTLAFAFLASVMCGLPAHHDGQTVNLGVHYGQAAK